MTPQGDILVEGGPVHQRISRLLAVLVGVVVGLTGGLGFDTLLALRTSSEIASSRENAILVSCRQANQDHATAKAGIEAIAAQTPKPPGQTAAAKQKEHRLLNQFVDALSPSYLAGHGPLVWRERQGCAKRVRELTKP